MPQTVAASTTNAHPILVEVVETRLVWIQAESADAAVEQATTFVNDVIGPDGLTHMPLVDASLQARAVTRDLADWLDADPDQVEYLDNYFAAHTG